MVQNRQVRKRHMLKTIEETLEAKASKSGMDEYRRQPGLRGVEGGCLKAGGGEGSGIDENFRPVESVYLLMLCGLPWRAVIIIKSDDYCA
jgi:hypothetical protein